MMTQFPRYRSIAFAAAISALALSGCSKPSEEAAPSPADQTAPRDAAASATVASEATAGAVQNRTAPVAGVVPSLTPPSATPPAEEAVVPGAQSVRDVTSGVAFTYEMQFRLPDDKVATAQDRHIAACAKLGQNHCRLTDIRYDQSPDKTIAGRATFLLDPAMAFSFTRDADKAVRELEGETQTARVNGDDAGGDIERSQQTSAAMGADIERLQRRLSQPGLTEGEKTRSRTQIEQLQGNLVSEERERERDERRLATTPVSFSYSGTTGVAGYDSTRPFASAFETSSTGLGKTAGAVLTIAGLILPWALLVGLIVLVVRLIRRRNQTVATPATTE